MANVITHKKTPIYQTQVVVVVFELTFNHNYECVSVTHNYSEQLKSVFDLNDVPSYQCNPWCKETMNGFQKKFCIKVISSYKLSSPMLWLSNIPIPPKQLQQYRTNEILRLQSSQLLPTTPCTIVGQGRVVMIVFVTNAPCPSLSYKDKSKSKFKPQTTNHQNGGCVINRILQLPFEKNLPCGYGSCCSS